MASLVCSGTGACHRKVALPSGTPINASATGTLPAGCSVVATLDPSMSMRLGGTLDAVLSTHLAKVSNVGGLDFRRDVHRVSYCQMEGAARSTRFLLLLSGNISAGVLDAVAAMPEGHWVRERIGDSPVVGQGNFWAAHRDGVGWLGELLLASDKDVLRLALLSPPGIYPLEATMPFSAVISGSALGRSRRDATPGQLSVLNSVQELRLSMPFDASSLVVRVIVTDRAAAEPLTKAIGPVLSAIAKGLSKPGEPEAKVVAENSGGDVVARVELSGGALDSLLASIGTRARRK